MNLSLLLEMAAGGFGERVLYSSRPQADGEELFTAARLYQLSRAAARHLTAAGATGVVYLATNSPTFPLALFAAAAAGVPMIPLNYRLSAEQLADQLAADRDSYLIVDPVIAERIGCTGWVSPAEFLAMAVVSVEAGADAAPLSAADPDDIALLLYTSGTTSKPKAAVLRHRHLTAYVTNTVEFGSAGAEEAGLVSVPPYHVAGVSNTVTNLYAGRRVIHLPDFSPESWLDTARTQAATHALVVPTMLARIVDHLGGRPGNTPSLRTLSYGGAPMPADVVARALRTFPGVDFVNAYGLTETSSTIALLGPDEHRAALAATDHAGRARLGSAGRLLPDIEAEIRGPDGEPVAAGAPGTLWVRGPQVSGEYRDGAAHRDPAGWFDTRDEAYLDADGYLFIVGRADDTIIRGGENIAPVEIEEALRAHDSVLDAAVVGIPDREWGHRIAAAVVVAPQHRDSTSPEQLMAHVRGLLRSSKTPDQIVFVAGLPYNDMGKLSRRSVAESVLTGSETGTNEVTA
ncbi:class I adenylate-forming enzyme family protein [Nocardia jinanensis]|uniref:Long-chain fatty acid--CoA ligase n=1 Tax=Nocardia jinanensis TaxID=382504 RepID=A0A917RMW3_9NOCA|nr:fatty acid--CoA ligase family protein [Nocardia jinanensis]GGL15191.1 hypothetical protein GCM10011588_32190 [Nocardia jinanensis]